MRARTWLANACATCALIGAVSAQCPTKLLASDAREQDLFGYDVALDGGSALVSAGQARSGPFLSVGAVYVFDHDDGGTPGSPADDSWVEVVRLSPSLPQAHALFRTVALDADTALVGAYNEGPLGSNFGAAYVYARDRRDPLDPGDDVWVETRLSPLVGVDEERFGAAVDLDRDTALIGASHDGPGHAYVFRRDPGDPLDPYDDAWSQAQRLAPDDGASGDHFGAAVAVEGGLLVVGAPDHGGLDQGAAYVFELDDAGTPPDPSDDQWVLRDRLGASDAGLLGAFGVSVALSGERVLVGSFQDSAYVFERDDQGTPLDPGDDTWEEVAQLERVASGIQNWFGAHVALEDDRAVLSQRHGVAAVFERSAGGTWSEATTLGAWGGDGGIGPVAVQGDLVLAGAALDAEEGFEAGAAYVFRIDPQQACAGVRNGTYQRFRGFVNPRCYANLALPVLGGTWQASVAHDPAATATVVLFYDRLARGKVTRFGELLVGLGGVQLCRSLVASSGTFDLHAATIPNDPLLAGRFAASQAVVLQPGATHLCNAVDLVMGF